MCCFSFFCCCLEQTKLGVGLNSAIYSKETTLEKTLKTKKKKKKKRPVRERDGEQEPGKANDQEEDEEGDCNDEGEQENSGHREKASSALIPPKKDKPRRRAKVKEEALDKPESPDIEQRALSSMKLLIA